MSVVNAQFGQNIPIVGQPFTLTGWFPTASIVCNCDAKSPVLLYGINVPAQCPACKRAFVIIQVQHNPQNNQHQIGIGVVMAPTEKPAS